MAILKPYMAVFYFVGAFVLFFLSLDILYSLLANPTCLLIHEAPVSILIIVVLWTSIINLLATAARLQSLTISRQAGKRTIVCFWVLFLLLVAMCAAMYDVWFSRQFVIPRSLLFDLPLEKDRIYSFIIYPGLVLLIPFLKLCKEIIVEVDPDINLQFEEEEN